MHKIERPYIQNATYQVPRPLAFWFWKRFYRFYRICAWWPSWLFERNFCSPTLRSLHINLSSIGLVVSDLKTLNGRRGHHRHQYAIADKNNDSGSEVIKLFSKLNSADHEIYPAHRVNMSTIVVILTFISMINTTPERLKAGNFFICLYYSVYEQLKYRAQLSLA